MPGSRVALRAGAGPVRRGRVLTASVVLVLALTSALAVSGLAGLALGPSPTGGARAAESAGTTGGPGARDGAEPPARDDAAPASPAVTPERVSALTSLLAARSTALLAADRRGWLGALAPGTGYAARQGEVFDRLAGLPVAAWRWEYLGVGASLPPERVRALGGGAGGPGAGRADGTPWVAHVALVYALEGAGGPVHRDQYLTLAGGAGRWVVADDGDGPTAKDLWDLGPVSLARGVRSLVLGTDVADYPALVDAASTAVDAAWGTRWSRTSVVEVPADQAQMAALLGRPDPAALDRVAAVTTGETLGGGAVTTGDRVVVNPEGLARLTPQGRAVVLTHELTHVATRAGALTSVPTWFSEGYADWVGYRGRGLADADLARPLLEAARGDGWGGADDGDGSGDGGDGGEGAPGPLRRLPDEAAFDPAGGDVAVAYAGSWLAVDLLARRWGDDAVTALYRDVASGATTPPATLPSPSDTAGSPPDGPDARLDRALRARLGVDTAALTARWRERALALARAEP